MNKYKKYILFSLLVAIFGEIYFYPFDSRLKFSAGVAVLQLIILIEDNIDEKFFSLLCGIMVFAMRSIFNLLFTSMKLKEIIVINIPSLIYYIVFGFLCYVSRIVKNKDNLLRVLITFTIIDSLSNICESLLRRGISLNIVQGIIAAGMIRSLVAYIIYFIYNRQKFFILKKEYQKRYTQINLLVADIQAEIFYLKKSLKDIEDVMGRSYSLYETHKEDCELREQTLSIAREVHEIKKDYLRVLKGFESFIRSFERDETMSLSNIFIIIRDNTDRCINESNKNIKITFKFQEDISLKSYYNLFTILNNLIMNSIDACKDNDEIKILEEHDEEFFYFTVSDTGEGIDKDVIPYIFNPGFTTKFDTFTGKASTGIGLPHIKNIIDNLNGVIYVESRIERGTTFKIKIPKISLVGGKNGKNNSNN